MIYGNEREEEVMCGMAGIMNLSVDSVSDLAEIDAMLNKIRHRGPDDSGVCGITTDNHLLLADCAEELKNVYKGILGFNRLSIQDVSQAGHQPMVSRDGQVVITFNGEIYNVKELRNILIKKNYFFRGTSDTEVILYLYQEYGFDKMVKMLNGMFAIVLYDAVFQKLYLARDRFGIIPLYVWHRNRSIIWASEIKCFMALSDFARKINHVSFSRALQYCYPNDSLYVGIQSVEPGTYIEIDVVSKLLKTHLYFNINELTKDITCDKKRILDKCDFLLRKCVERQLISDVNVGVQFSGGVDSTLLAKYVSDYFDQRKSKLYGFSLINQNYEDYSEEFWIDHASSCIPIQVKKFDMSPEQFLDNFENSIYAYERLINIPSPIGIYEFSKNAKKDVTVLISGEGADEVCGGYGSFSQWKALSWMRNPQLLGSIHRFDGKLIKNEEEFLLWFDMQMPQLKCQKLLSFYDNGGIVEERKDYWRHLQGTDFDKVRKLYFKYELISLLERQNKICMANSVENRVPFLDNEVVEFMFAIPEDDLLHRQIHKIFGQRKIRISKAYEGKYVLKQLSKKIYGNKFAFRDKQAIRVPLNQYIKGEKFREYMEDLIVPKLKQRGAINTKYFDWAYEHIDVNDNAVIVWKAINFEVWCQLFIDGRAPISN